MKVTDRIFAIFLAAACLSTFAYEAFGQNDGPKIKAGKKYTQTGAKLESPKEPDWRVVKAETTETVFAKTTAEKKFTAFVKTARIPVYETDEELFANLEKLKMTEVDEATRDSIHYYNVEYKSTPCLQYDGIFNAPDTGFKHRNMSGYICRHPNDKGTIVQFEFSNYSNDRGYLRSEAELSKTFFEGVQFKKLK